VSPPLAASRTRVGDAVYLGGWADVRAALRMSGRKAGMLGWCGLTVNPKRPSRQGTQRCALTSVSARDAVDRIARGTPAPSMWLRLSEPLGDREVTGESWPEP